MYTTGEITMSRCSIKYLVYSLGSCDETADHLYTLYETKSLTDKKVYEYFCEEYDHLGKMINNFIKSVENTHKTDRQVSNIK